MNVCKCSATIALVSLVFSAPISAQDEPYPPGTLVPMIDLELRQVPVEVPDQFRSAVPEGLTLNLPPGFSVSVFAAGNLNYPRFMAFDDGDVLHVSDMSRGRIIALPDGDGDGVADRQIVAASGFKTAHSLAFYKGDLYVAETHQVVRLHDADGDLFYEQREVFIEDIPSHPFHGTRTIVFDKINEKIYLSVGSPCDLCRSLAPVAGAGPDLLPPNPEWGSVLEFNADGTGRRIFSSGVRNVVGMDLHPVTNELWGNNNGHDLEGRTRPPEWIDIMRDGDFMGHPLVHSHQVWNDFEIDRYQRLLPITREDSLLVQRQKRPVALVPAHYAPMGIHFYTHDLFPSMYKNAAFVSFHAGKAKLSSHPGYNVSALFCDEDGSNARMGAFITGFQTGTTQGDVWGFPQGLATDQEGNLYVGSDLRNKLVLRVAHSPVSGSWEHTLPDSIPSGASLAIAATVHLERFVLEGETPRLYADLSALGGPANLPLVALGDNTYWLETTLDVAAPMGEGEVLVHIEQDTPQGRTFSTQLIKSIDIVSPLASSWQHALPDSVRSGAALDIQTTVHLERFAANGETPRLHADLSDLGGPANLPLVALGDNTYRLDTTFDVEAPGGLREVRVYIEQDTPLGAFEIQLVQPIVVVPNADLLVFADALNHEWVLEHNTRIAPTDAPIEAYRGHAASAFQSPPRTLGGWTMTFLPAAPFDQIGYKALRFAFHPGDMTAESGSTLEVSIAHDRPARVGWPNVRPADIVPARTVDLLSGAEGPYVDLGRREWQMVEIPLAAFAWSGPIERIGFAGTIWGTFLLDDIRLVTDVLPVTAVREARAATLPQRFALEQNYPNPFNKSTVIRFALLQRSPVHLAIYNLMGQRVATLVEGPREAGFYTVYWNGTTQAGGELATGVYLYRLQAGEWTLSRKLLLLQ